ncbi:MAG: hypothetical protein ACT4NX_01760 [Deltaproteobacteria bacterium]
MEIIFLPLPFTLSSSTPLAINYVKGWVVPPEYPEYREPSPEGLRLILDRLQLAGIFEQILADVGI